MSSVDDDPIYTDSHGVDWWWDGHGWNYWRDDTEWVRAPRATPVGLFETDDTVPVGARPAPPGYQRAADSRLYPR